MMLPIKDGPVFPRPSNRPIQLAIPYFSLRRKNMKTVKFLFVAACVLGLAASAFAQVQTRQSPGILGYLDPKTGAFHTLPVPDSDSAEALTTTTVGGTFIVKF